MISKKHRLTEREVKRVLRKGKPFFAYHIVVNYTPNTLDHSRFWLVIGAKNIPTNVQRNFFRRRFYDISSKYLDAAKHMDAVFVLKKKTKLDKNDIQSIDSFDQDIQFLFKKII